MFRTVRVICSRWAGSSSGKSVRRRSCWERGRYVKNGGERGRGAVVEADSAGAAAVGVAGLADVAVWEAATEATDGLAVEPVEVLVPAGELRLRSPSELLL